MASSVAIEVTGLGKTYDGVVAVQDLSLTVHAGEIFGLLGPNGAGKSTTLRILITTLKPTSGHATILGHDVLTEADTVRRLIGYVPQERAIDRFLTGREHLLLLGDLYHLPKDESIRRIGELLKLVDLEDHADRVAKTYSGGMKRKLDIACGLLPNPQILFLDEPTLGLDVQSRLNIWDYVRRLREHGIVRDPGGMAPWVYEMRDLGFNYRISDLQCALGVSQLSKLDRWLERRREIAAAYDAAFRNLRGVTRPWVPPDVEHAYHLYVLQVPQRRIVFEELRNRGIGVQVHYIPVHTQPYYRDRFGLSRIANYRYFCCYPSELAPIDRLRPVKV